MNDSIDLSLYINKMFFDYKTGKILDVTYNNEDNEKAKKIIDDYNITLNHYNNLKNKDSLTDKEKNFIAQHESIFINPVNNFLKNYENKVTKITENQLLKQKLSNNPNFDPAFIDMIDSDDESKEGGKSKRKKTRKRKKKKMKSKTNKRNKTKFRKNKIKKKTRTK